MFHRMNTLESKRSYKHQLPNDAFETVLEIVLWVGLNMGLGDHPQKAWCTHTHAPKPWKNTTTTNLTTPSYTLGEI